MPTMLLLLVYPLGTAALGAIVAGERPLDDLLGGLNVVIDLLFVIFLMGFLG